VPLRGVDLHYEIRAKCQANAHAQVTGQCVTDAYAYCTSANHAGAGRCRGPACGTWPAILGQPMAGACTHLQFTVPGLCSASHMQAQTRKQLVQLSFGSLLLAHRPVTENQQHHRRHTSSTASCRHILVAMSDSITARTQAILDGKTKPKGSLGQLEQWALLYAPGRAPLTLPGRLRQLAASACMDALHLAD
jgi:hypothetical protein